MRREQICIAARTHSQRGTTRKTSEEPAYDQTGKAFAKPRANREEHEYRRRQHVHDLSAVLLTQRCTHNGTEPKSKGVQRDS